MQLIIAGYQSTSAMYRLLSRARLNLINKLQYLNVNKNVTAAVHQIYTFYLKIGKLYYFLRRYPIPFFAMIGLLLGAIVFLIMKSQELAQWIWLLTLILGGAPIVAETLRGMIRGHFASDIVAMLAIVVAVIYGEALPGVIIVLMQSGGKALEDYALTRASSSLNALLARSPKYAYKKTNNNLEKIEVSFIKVGDLLVVRPGDLIPVDGHITKGRVLIDESALTGEPMPKNKDIGDNVFSGTVNNGDAFEIIATKISEESQYAKIVQLVKKAQAEKAPIQRLADRYAIWFTPIVLAVSFFGWFITTRPETILSVLVVATPCSLIFATPVAIMSGINKAAKIGIMIKSGSSMEQVGRAEVVIFDKTGTITLGFPVVEKLVAFNNINEKDLLYKAASLGQLSSHPVSAALVQKARQNLVGLTLPTNFHEIPSIGVEGDIKEEHIFVGSRNLIGDELRHLQENTSLKDELESPERMLAFVEINRTLVGVIILSDKLRKGVKSMVEQLYKLGIKETIILTGDNIYNAKIIAKQAGITQFEANLLPDQKTNSVKKLREIYNPVIMVGDGINDAPALASADVGIAMGSQGSAISVEAADIVLLIDDVTKVSNAIEIGRKTIQIAKQSIIVGLGASIVCMVIASFGFIPPTLGALLQEIMDVCVILNALRAR